MKVIDERFIFVWSGDDFPYVNVLSIASVVQHHPQARIDICFIDHISTSPYVAEVASFPNVHIEVVQVHELCELLPETLHFVQDIYRSLPSSAASARSNIVRYILLYLRGGIYLDFDVVLLRSMDALRQNEAFIGEEFVWVDDLARLQGERAIFLAPRNLLWACSHAAMWLDAHLCRGRMQLARRLDSSSHLWSKPQVNNAIIGSVASSKLLHHLLTGLKQADVEIRYSTGPTLVEHIARMTPENVNILDNNAFYFIAPGQSYRLFFDTTVQVPPNAYAIHYAASNHRRFISEANPESMGDIAAGSVLEILFRQLREFFGEHS